MIPELKKRLSGFLLSEDGKMPKQSLLALGSFLSAAVIGGVIASKDAASTHTNSLTASYAANAVTAQHGHHSSHSSHASGTTVTTGTTAVTTGTTFAGDGDQDVGGCSIDGCGTTSDGTTADGTTSGY